MRTIILSCFVFLCLVFSLALKAQNNPQPHFRNYSTEHGLPSPEVYTAFQDSKGYMWFGTDNGASRFDGYEFKNYGAKQGLSSNVVFNIFEDEEQNIWFGTMTGEAFILEGDTIVPYKYNNIVLSFSNQYLLASLVHLSKDGTCYFKLVHAGILEIASDGGNILHTSKNPAAQLIFKNGKVPNVISTDIRRYEDPNYDSHVTSLSKKNKFALEVQDPSGHQLKLLPKGVRTWDNHVAFNSFQLASGSLLVFYYQQVFCIQEGVLLWSRPWSYAVNELVEDNDGAIWICGSAGMGLRRYDNLLSIKENEFSTYFQGFSIASFSIDKDEGGWITTQEQGIFYMANQNLRVFGKSVGLSDDFVTTVSFKDEETIFIGCKNGDVFEFDLAVEQISNRIKNPWGYHNFDIFYLHRENVLWSNGAFWKGDKWNFIQYQELPSRKKAPVLLHRLDNLQIDQDSNLVGSHSHGLFMIDLNTKELLLDPSHSAIRERVYSILCTKENQTWVGLDQGIFQFRDEEFHKVNISHPAFNARVEDISQLKNQHLVLATKGWGVVIWDRKQNFTILTEDQGLTTNMIEDVHVDENGTLWVGTLNGLNKVTYIQEGGVIVKQFTMANGLASNEIYKIKSYKDQVWLCTAGGLVQFQEPEAEETSLAPFIQSIEINGKDQAPEDSLRVSHRNNNFVFQYLTINYKQNGNIQYRFRLHENDDWSYTKNRTANYPALPPDQYRFEVQSKNEDGLWSNSTIQYFTITPPWWATSWFIILVSLSFMASSFGIFQYRLQQLRKRSLIQQQISDLEKSALQAQMNPHFIFNCLNSIQNFILQHNSQKAVDFLSRFARLVRLHLNASIDGYISLEEEISLLDNYLILEQERFDHKFQFQLELGPSIEADQIQIPPLLIQPFVENAIVHGMANKQEDGRIKIKFLKKEEHLQVSIRDNGNDQDSLNSNRKSHGYKSVGMSITQKRLQLMDQSQTEVLEITSIQDQDPQTEGTLVTILIKYQSL